MKGTFVLYDVAARTYRGHDETRANQRFVPASTFKIPNSLIGLTVGAVAGPDEVLPYRGIPPLHPGVGAGHEPARGHPVVNVPIYQELARRVGLAPMGSRWPAWTTAIGTSAPRWTAFGSMARSRSAPWSRCAFFARLAEGSLPFPAAAQAAVRDITRLERGPGWTLHGKTGWWNAPGPGLGWWVGWWTGRAVSSPLP